MLGAGEGRSAHGGWVQDLLSSMGWGGRLLSSVGICLVCLKRMKTVYYVVGIMGGHITT